MRRSNSGRRYFLLATLAVIGICFTALGAGKEQPNAPQGLLSELRPDQPVILIERNDRYEIRPVADALERSHKIVEVGSDYVLLRDITGQIEVVIPVYSIKCVMLVRDLQADR